MRAAQISEKFLLMIGLLKLALVAMFFLSFPFMESANVHANDACTGENLIEKMRTEEPDKYAEVLAHAEAIENGGSIFWRIEKEGHPSSFLFGTMHMADPKIATLQTDVIDALKDVETVVLETTDVLNMEAAKASMAELAHLTLMPSGSSLKDLINDDLEDELDEAVAARGIPAFVANRMQPWLVATTVALPICEMSRKNSGEQVLDAVLGNYAIENGKQVKGLETSKEQLEAIALLPQDYHVSALEETLKSGNQSQDMSETMKALYLNGEISKILPLMRVLAPESFNGEGAVDFERELIDKRNFNMVERSLPILEKERVFIAVGALHLPGEKGIVKLLRDNGYIVTALR